MENDIEIQNVNQTEIRCGRLYRQVLRQQAVENVKNL